MTSERTHLLAVRRAILPTMFLPVALALVAVSIIGGGPPLQLVGPPAVIAVVATISCWWSVLKPQPAHHGRSSENHRRSNAPSAVKFDWSSFVRQFWAYVEETERRQQGETAQTD